MGVSMRDLNDIAVAALVKARVNAGSHEDVERINPALHGVTVGAVLPAAFPLVFFVLIFVNIFRLPNP